jgi:hypothetical protein
MLSKKGDERKNKMDKHKDFSSFNLKWFNKISFFTGTKTAQLVCQGVRI